MPVTSCLALSLLMITHHRHAVSCTSAEGCLLCTTKIAELVGIRIVMGNNGREINKVRSTKRQIDCITSITKVNHPLRSLNASTISWQTTRSAFPSSSKSHICTKPRPLRQKISITQVKSTDLVVNLRARARPPLSVVEEFSSIHLMRVQQLVLKHTSNGHRRLHGRRDREFYVNLVSHRQTFITAH